MLGDANANILLFLASSWTSYCGLVYPDDDGLCQEIPDAGGDEGVIHTKSVVQRVGRERRYAGGV